jgi:hypothetical protein
MTSLPSIAEKHHMVSHWNFTSILNHSHTLADFNDHQRDVFCVFSGNGVNRLRVHLNQEASQSFEAEGTMYDDSNIDDGDINELIVLPPAQANQQLSHQQDQSLPHIQSMQDFPALPPPPPPAPQLQQNPFSHHPQQHSLPPLQIPRHPQTGGPDSPNAMSPTHDAPLTLEDEHFSDDDFNDQDIVMGPAPSPAPTSQSNA